MTLHELLKENERRLAEKEKPYDPVTGDADDPRRVKVFSPEGKLCHVPPSMLAMHDQRQLSTMTPAMFHELRCLHDFPYWAATCCYIKRKKGGDDILFKLNGPQRKLVGVLEEMRLNEQPIRLILLKARQWGGSTCVQMYMSWIQMLAKTGLNSLIVAHQHAGTYEILNMFLRMIERYPEEMFPKGDNGKTVKRTMHDGPGSFRVPSRNFKVKVGSAERPESCRGGDYSLVHCTEVAMWKKTRLKSPQEMLTSACSGVLYEPLTMILLESTAKGTENFFHDEYEAAKSGESQFKPLFVAWYEIEQYSLPFKEGERETFARELLEGREDEQPLSERRQPGAYLWWLWERGATLESIHWYVKERAKYNDHGDMASEYPSDDVEAFVHSGAKVFDKYRVEELRKGCRVAPKRGEICGEQASGPESLRNLHFTADGHGALLIWENEYIRSATKEMNRLRVKVANRYLAVVDIGGRSRKADWSVIAVIDRLPMITGDPPEIRAQWRGHTDFDLLAWNAARIAKYFDDALLVVESNTLETHDKTRVVEGDQSHFLLNQLKKAYPNLYARKQRPDEIREGAPVRYGFHTNMATKPMIISNLVKVVREGLYVERDPQCLNEYLSYEQRPDGSYGAVAGRHDDILMTRAIGLHICFNEMPLPREVIPCDYNDTYSPYHGSAAYF